jgi:hypothetical protein
LRVVPAAKDVDDVPPTGPRTKRSRRRSIAHPEVKKSASEPLPEKLTIFIIGPNRFASLPVERTKDEIKDEQDRHWNQGQSDNGTSSNARPKRRVQHPDGHSRDASPLHRFAELVALLDGESDSELDGGVDLADTDTVTDTGDISTISTLPSPTLNNSIPVPATDSITFPKHPHLFQRRPHLLDPFEPNIHAVCSDTATDGWSETGEDRSRQMPWEEDDWEERRMFGVRALSWSRTRVVAGYKQGKMLLMGEEGGVVRYF